MHPYEPTPTGLASDLLDRHLNRRTRSAAAARLDPTAQMQLHMLRDLLDIVQAACDDEELHPATTRRILERVIYGGVPSWAEAERRQQLLAATTEIARSPAIVHIDPSSF